MTETTTVSEQTETTVFALDEDNHRRLRALTACTSTDQAKPVLCTVAFDGHWAWATDSYIMARVDVPYRTGNEQGTRPNVMVDAKTLKTALKTTRDERARLVFREDCLVVEIVKIPRHSFSGDGALEYTQVAPAERTAMLPYVPDRFPDVWQLIPSEHGKPSETPPFFDARKLAKVAACAPLHPSILDHPPVKVRTQHGERKPLIVESAPRPGGGPSELVGLVMPVSING